MIRKFLFLSFLACACATPAIAQQVVQIRPGESVTVTAVPNGPIPDPVPTPTGPVTKFVVIEETAKAGQFRGELLVNKDVQKFIAASHLKWRIVDIDAARKAPDVAAQVAEVAGKPLPYLFLVGADGKTISSQPCPLKPADFLAAFKPPAPKYALGNVMPKAGLKNKWVKVGETNRIVSIPRADWKEISLEAFLPPVRDQGQIGKCNAEATVNAFMTARKISGLSFQDLSDDYLYAQICFKDQWGRRQDSGSLLEDGLKWMTDNGTCTRNTVRDGNWNPREFPAQAATEATEFTVEEAYLCPDFDAVASAVQQGFPVIVGIDWSNNFFSVDQDGWLPMQRGGSAGGHAIMCYGVTQRNGVWGAQCRNSWGSSWGKAGNFVIPEQHFQGMVGGYWAVRSVKQSRPEGAAIVPPTALFDGVRWVKILASLRTAINSKDFARIVELAQQAAALIGYGNVADDVAAIVKAAQSKDWPALVPPLVDLLQFGLKQFGVGGTVEGVAETTSVIDLLQQPAPTTAVPQTAAPLGKRWTKIGNVNSPHPWVLEDVAPPAPQVMPRSGVPGPARQFFNSIRPGVLQSCPNGNCPLGR